MTYSLVRTLQGFEDSVNCLQFSPNGEWLAAGGDDGCLAIFHVACEDIEGVNLVAPAPVTSLLWHPVETNSIFVGYSSGDIFLYHLELQNWFPSGSQIDAGVAGPVEALEYDTKGDTLAAIVGSEVFLCNLKHKLNGRYILRKCPHPPATPDAAGGIEVSPCSIHYIDDGQAIIVSYLHHGLICWDVETTQMKWALPSVTRIARSAISPDRKSVVVCNLQGGFDRYRVDLRKVVQSYSVPIGELNVPLPASFIQHGDALVLGSACGTVVIVDKDDGSRIQTLDHAGDDMIQAIAYVIDGSQHLIATGTSERGRNTRIRLWAMDSSECVSSGPKHESLEVAEIRLPVRIPEEQARSEPSDIPANRTEDPPHNASLKTESMALEFGQRPRATRLSPWFIAISVAILGMVVGLLLLDAGP